MMGKSAQKHMAAPFLLLPLTKPSAARSDATHPLWIHHAFRNALDKCMGMVYTTRRIFVRTLRR